MLGLAVMSRIVLRIPMEDILLFDLGGVLVELMGVAQMIAWSGLDEKRLWSRWLECVSVRDFETGRIGPQEFAERTIEELELRVDPDLFLRRFIQFPKGFFPGAVDYIRSLSKTSITATLSNTNVLHWERLCSETDVERLFHRCFLSHRIGLLKPDEAVYRRVLEELDVPPERIVYVDDLELNVEAARRLGIRAFLARGFEDMKNNLAALGIRPRE